ncbi:hypothetical protein C0991_001756, partial [Blastosporella zonata]
MTERPPVIATEAPTAWMERMEVGRAVPLPLIRGPIYERNIPANDYNRERQKQLQSVQREPSLRPLEKHNYRSDGLLDVNPNGPHPIFELIRNAEKTWDARLAKASKTLSEAVAEYQRRYTRLPPRNFDI